MQMGVWAHEDGQGFESLGDGAAPRIGRGLSAGLLIVRYGTGGLHGMRSIVGTNTIDDMLDIRGVFMHNM